MADLTLIGLLTSDIAGLAAGDVPKWSGSAWARDTAVARRPVVGDNVRYVTVNGNDGNDGLSWGTAKRTLQAAHDSFTGLSSGGTIYAGKGTFTETFTPTKSDIAVIGQGVHPSNGSMVKPPSASANGIVIDGSVGGGSRTDTTFEGICVYTNDYPTYSGTGWYIKDAPRLRLLHCSYFGTTTAVASATVGGTALRVENTEGAYFESFYFAGASVGIDLVNEATSNLYVNTKGSENYRELVVEGNSGGNQFIQWKTTHSNSATPYVVDIGGLGQNIFTAADWSESTGARLARVTSPHNTFIGGAGSPQTSMYVTGDRNLLDGWKVQKHLEISGADNILRRVWVDAGDTLTNAGTGTVFDRLKIESGATVTYAGAVATAERAVGAALATNAASGFLYVPTCAGTPTGTPAAQTGLVPLIFDTTNAKLYVYSGGSWKGGTAPGVFS